MTKKDSSVKRRQSTRKPRGFSKRPVISRLKPTPTVPNINSNKTFIGQLGEKKFGNIWHKGIITKKTNDDPVWYKIKYEDGDSEELDLPEIEEVIQNYKNNHKGEKQDPSINNPGIITDISQLLKINNNTKDLTPVQRGYNNGVINKFFIFYERIVLKRETITPALIEKFDEFMTPYKGRINGVLTIKQLRSKGYYYFGYYKTNDLITKAVTQVHNKIEEFNTINSTDTRLLTIETDLYNVFLENILTPRERTPGEITNYYNLMAQRYYNKYNETYDPEYLYIRDQIRWYVMYRQTFIIDSIHDFGKNPLIYVLIDQYRIEINNLLSEINKLTDYSFNNDSIFIDTDEEASIYTNYKGASEDEPITTEILQGNYTNKRLLSKINPTEHMKNILNDINLLITGTSTLNLKKISGIESVIAFNSGLTNEQVKNKELKFVYGLDALSKRFKYPSTLNFLDRLGKKTWNKLYKVQSLADKYDAGSSKSKSFVKSIIVNLENNLTFKEFFNFHLGINKEYKHNLLDYSLTKKGEKVELNLRKFSTSEGNWINTDSKKNYVESLLVTGDTPVNIQAKFMYKLLGDDSKSSVLYGIFTNQIKIPGLNKPFTTNYISNDITSAMKASIKLPGGLVISSAADPFVDETKLSNVEFFSQREWLPQWLLEQRVSNFFESGDIATFEEINENRVFFGKRIRSKNNKMSPKTNKNKKFIQTALSKMRKRGTLGSFKKWCIKNRLISVSGKVTKKCINLAKKSPNLKIRRKAIFAQNIKAYQGSKRKKSRKTSRKVLKNKIPKSLKKLAKKYSVRLTTKRGYKSVQQIKKQIKLRMRRMRK